MVNPILNNPMTNGIKELINKFVGTAKIVKNPQIALQSIIQNNPKFKQYENIMDDVNKYVENHGGDAETACRQLASEYGVDINALMKMFK